MSAAQSAIASLTTERRTDHFLDVKLAGKSLGIHPNKVSDWVYRTGDKIDQIFRDQPGAMAAQMALWIARAQANNESK